MVVWLGNLVFAVVVGSVVGLVRHNQPEATLNSDRGVPWDAEGRLQGRREATRGSPVGSMLRWIGGIFGLVALNSVVGTLLYMVWF